MKQRVVVVTGAAGNLGRGIALAFAETGVQLALLNHRVSEFATPGSPLVVGDVDLADPPGAAAAMQKVAEHFGRLDVLVNVVGGFRWETLEHGNVETWDLMYRLNVRTTVVACQAALPHLLASARNRADRRGRIINIGAAAAAKSAVRGMGAYAAAKAGVQKLTESLADELDSRGITVNAILPSIIDTPENRADMPDADFSRWVTPDAVARVAVFLASPDASAITGASIPVVGRQ